MQCSQCSVLNAALSMQRSQIAVPLSMQRSPCNAPVAEPLQSFRCSAPVAGRATLALLRLKCSRHGRRASVAALSLHRSRCGGSVSIAALPLLQRSHYRSLSAPDAVLSMWRSQNCSNLNAALSMQRSSGSTSVAELPLQSSRCRAPVAKCLSST
jgi:hypothetical protein